ncbi:MAG: hydantoinase B/oxoprolinase family protein [Thermomicrobiales bacterium]|nr:hydantoinase B/oxoprolinase family protein [Thermomicrobiales bacterium]
MDVAGSGPSARDDAFTKEIIRNKLLAVASEMGVVLARSSMSPIVYEVLDFACGICDATGRVIAQDNGLCLFTGTFKPQVESILAKWPIEQMRPGDVYMTNSPYGGGTHTADIALVNPIFGNGRVLAFGISVTHWTEVGGKVLGSLAPDSTEIFQEGLQFPRLRLMRDGQINETIVDMIEANVRLPLMSLGDLNAGIAAGRIAETRLTEIIEKYGIDTTLETFETILDHGEALARRALAAIPAGVYEAEDIIDGDGVSDDPIHVRVKVTVSVDSMTADFTGCAPQTRGPINCARGALMSACKTIFKAIVAPQAPSNEGLFRPFELIAPEGTVFTATRPASTGWYFEASAFATELIWRALAPVLPDHLSAGSYVSLCAYYIGGNRPNGDYWVLATPQDGGWGACVDRDGESSLIATTDGDTYNYPAEVIETAFPLTMLRNAFNVEAGGGAGAYRGGFGTIREYRIESDSGGSMLASLGRSVQLPWGVDGGEPGTPNYFEVIREDGNRVRGGRVTGLPLKAGDVVRIVTGNGGGWGEPALRDRDAVLRDVADGLIDPERAGAVYGIAVTA